MSHSAFKPIEVQIAAIVQAPRNGRRIPEDLIRQAIMARTQGQIVPGIELRIVKWRHGHTAPWHAAENSPDEWERFARFLQSAPISVKTK